MRKKQSKVTIVIGVILLILITILPVLIKNLAFSIIVIIRDAINMGDSGKLIVAAARTNIFFSIYNILLYICMLLLLFKNKWFKEKSFNIRSGLLIIAFLAIKSIYRYFFIISWEPFADLFALVLIATLVNISRETDSYIANIIISIQVFFAMQWINIIPILSKIWIGSNDIYVSIKTVSRYLNSEGILNAVGIAFLAPLLLSSIMTALLYRIHHRNIIVVEENFQKARELEGMKAKIMENKIYEEINALAHDLKTPLVTIRGLNSLLLLSKDVDKLTVYNNRIENAVSKMNEMISSFLYSKSKQVIEIPVLLNYIRAQIPIEDESLKFDIIYDNDLPPIKANKVRISRAIINLIENAIIVECRGVDKEIKINIYIDEDIIIKIIDNGIGIKEVDLEQIWEIGHSTKETSGLGLPFAKQIIEENGGRIYLDSTYGVGTTLTVRLPIATEDKEE